MKKTVSFSKNAVNVFFHILTRCNLKCRHCYINPQQHGRHSLPAETIQKWLRVFASDSKATNVIFLGGEPTLHPELPFAVKQANALGYKSVTIDTNGYLFHDILNKVTPQEVDYFSFSLDGATARTNDHIRGKGSYDACLNGLRQAVSHGFNTSMIFTVSRLNIDELDLMGPLLKENRVNRFFIQVIGLRGNSAKASDEPLQVTRAQWLQVIPEAAERIARLGINVTYPKVFLDSQESFECAGLVAKNYFVFPNGRVYRCPLCEDFPLHSLVFEQDELIETGRINESDLFGLQIAEGCVMNRLIQPETLCYSPEGRPQYKVACCMLKEEIGPL